MTKLRAANSSRLQELEIELKEAEESSGESEIREILLHKSEYLCRIGDKTAAVTAFRYSYSNAANS